MKWRIILALALLPAASAAVHRVKYRAGNNYLIVEVLSDDLLHFEVSALGPGPDERAPIFTSPQVFKKDYAGPTSFTQSGPAGSNLETPHIKVAVDTKRLCVTATDKIKNLVLTTICPWGLGEAAQGLTLTPGVMQDVYGLGEQFIQAGNPNGDWTTPGHQWRTPGDAFGNQMVPFEWGAVGNAEIPVMYAVGPNDANYALFLDDIYKQSWDFSGNPWNMQTGGDQIRWYLITGRDLPALRQAYMDLTGRPPVPPKKMFGLWISQYGFHDWAEVDGKLASLRAHHFPIDGFVLDLQWFGGVPATGTKPSRMGSLTFDVKHFPDPAGKLADYRDKEGVGIMAIEESYIDRSLPEFADLKNRGFLVKLCQNGPYQSCDPALPCPSCPPSLYGPDWFGTVGMMDWTNDQGADYWHDLKREPLINMGLAGHWIDLGEPERYNPMDWVAGVLPGRHGQADYHNLYNFKWAESIARGYTRNGVQRRPFLMSRSGAAGIQRFGASMWSADIGSRLGNLAAHMNAQMHMSFSGIDYFGSDLGGFHREGLDSDLNDLYTRWFANGMMLDIPGRTHVDTHTCPYPVPDPPTNGCQENAPDRIGDAASNRENVRQRYELSPYLYSLAYRAYLFGEPVAPPLVYYYQNDPHVRRMGDEKMLGRDLLVATVTAPGPPNPHGETQRDVYLPAGDWVNCRSDEWFHSTGQRFPAQPEYVNGIFRLPVYARAGALIPKMYVDDNTMNVLGRRADGSIHNELITRVYASKEPTRFTFYEDDGETIAYRSGAFRSTALSQELVGNFETVTIGAASGSYSGALRSRNNVIELAVENAQATRVTLNGRVLPELTSQAAFDAASSGWLNAGNHLIVVKTGDRSVTSAKTLVFTLKAS